MIYHLSCLAVRLCCYAMWKKRRVQCQDICWCSKIMSINERWNSRNGKQGNWIVKDVNMRSPWKHPSKNEQKTKRSNAARKPLRLPIVVYYYDNITVLDATSHKNCVPHMNGGVSQADIGFIVISAQRTLSLKDLSNVVVKQVNMQCWRKQQTLDRWSSSLTKHGDESVLNDERSCIKARINECKTKLELYMRQVR